jgi:hypothetical protein
MLLIHKFYSPVMKHRCLQRPRHTAEREAQASKLKQRICSKPACASLLLHEVLVLMAMSFICCAEGDSPGRSPVGLWS